MIDDKLIAFMIIISLVSVIIGLVVVYINFRRTKNKVITINIHESSSAPDTRRQRILDRLEKHLESKDIRHDSSKIKND